MIHEIIDLLKQIVNILEGDNSRKTAINTIKYATKDSKDDVITEAFNIDDESTEA